MPRQERERVVKTLTQTRRHLLEWGVTELFLRTAKGRGTTKSEFVALYRAFVRQYYGRRNTIGEVILDHPSKARYWAVQFIKDKGWKPERPVTRRERLHVDDPFNANSWIYDRYGRGWVGLKIVSKQGRRLGWRLFENPDPPDDVAYVYGRPNPDDWEPDDAA